MWNDEEDVPREEADKDDEPDEVRPNVDRFVVEAEVEQHTYSIICRQVAVFEHGINISGWEKKALEKLGVLPSLTLATESYEIK